MRKITAQVAVEAIINCHGDGFDVATMEAVLSDGESLGVASLYLNMLADIIAEQAGY